MWLVVRLALAVIGLIVRRVPRRSATTPAGSLGGRPYVVRAWRRGRTAIGFDLAMPLAAPMWLSLRREGGIHRFARRLRLAREHHTGDPTFDDAVMVASDHPTAWATLARDGATRNAVLEALGAGFDRIHTDGKHLWMRKPGLSEPDEIDLEHAQAVRASFGVLDAKLPSRLRDGFAWKALVVEGVVWSLAGYALAVVLENSRTNTDLHVFRDRLLLPGLIAAAALLVVLVISTWLLLRRSPRGIAVILEASVVLLLAVPIAAVQTLADLNRGLDDGPAVELDVRVTTCRVTRSGQDTRYTIAIARAPIRARPSDARVELPASIGVAASLCDKAAAAGEVTLTVGRGRFGYAWYRGLSVGAEGGHAP